MDLPQIKRYLSHVKQRTSSNYNHEVTNSLKEFKQAAVKDSNQELAKLIWCYETIQKIQDEYIDAFHMMKGLYFYTAWCNLASVEKKLYSLERHFNFLKDGNDKFWLRFIKKYTEQFQSLYPYKLFFSGGYKALEKVCTICNKPISIRNPCGHIAGEIYNGELCARHITKVKSLEISLVEHPAHKACVGFIVSDKTNSSYNYCHVNYIVRGLSSPFDAWDMSWHTINLPITNFRHIGRNEMCPCKLGKKFKKCCLKKDFIEIRHLRAQFSVEPPSDLPLYEENVYVGAKDEPTTPAQGNDLNPPETYLPLLYGGH